MKNNKYPENGPVSKRLTIALSGAMFLGLAVFFSPVTMDPLAAQSEITDRGRIDVAHYTADGRMNRPDNIDQWVFMGASLGMGYSAANFNPESPGMFQIAVMEPTAYEAFLETGKFANGTMFALLFYSAPGRVSTNRSGFVLGNIMGTQIHVIDESRFKDGFNFFSFEPGQDIVEVLPDGNGCVTCHAANGAYDGVFAQFYPSIRHKIPKAALEKSLARGTEKVD